MFAAAPRLSPFRLSQPRWRLTTDTHHHTTRNGVWSGPGPSSSAIAYLREEGSSTLHIQSVTLLRGLLDVLLVSMNEIGAAYAYGRFIDCVRLYLGRQRRRRRRRRRLHRAVLSRVVIRWKWIGRGPSSHGFFAVTSRPFSLSTTYSVFNSWDSSCLPLVVSS